MSQAPFEEWYVAYLSSVLSLNAITATRGSAAPGQ